MPACSLKKPQRNKREIQNSLRPFAAQEAGRESNVHDILSEIVFSSRVSMRKIPVATVALLGFLIDGFESNLSIVSKCEISIEFSQKLMDLRTLF